MKKWLLLLIMLLLSLILYINKSLAYEATDDQLLKSFIRYGTLAPSSHNAQMWKVKILSNNKIKIFLDETRLLSEVDPNNRETFISLGAFIENISQIAQAYGYDTQVTPLAKSNNTKEIAELEFIKTKKYNKTIVKTLQKRHTNRSSYSKRAINQSVLNIFLQEFKENLYYYPLNSKEGQYIKNSLIESNKKQTNNDRKQKELANWMRLSWFDVLTKKDGITPKMMNMGLPIRLVVYTFLNKKSVTTDNFKQAGINKAKIQTENCAGFFVVTSKSTSPESLIDAGRILERFWLKATQNEISVHPMSQSLEELPWKDEINNKLNLGEPVQMILRVGYVKRDNYPTSKRIPVNQLLKN